MSKKNKTKYTSIGGQALIEGVMMRGPKNTAMAVRSPDGEIVVENVNSLSDYSFEQLNAELYDKVYPMIRDLSAAYNGNDKTCPCR